MSRAIAGTYIVAYAVSTESSEDILGILIANLSDP